MRYLLDTHALIWFMIADPIMPASIVTEIKSKNNDCFISIASLWEIVIKINIGKLTFPIEKSESFLAANDIKILPIYYSHLQQYLKLGLFHKDPFDRIIIAQGMIENLTILTTDKNFKHYPVKCLW